VSGVRLAIKRDGSLGITLNDTLWRTLPCEQVGGNKLRKLEWLAADALARGARALYTFGGEGSHHALATARVAQRLGLEAHLTLTPQPHSDHSRAVFEASAQLSTHLRLVSEEVLQEELLRAREARAAGPLDQEGCYVIPTGGSCALGALGMVEAALELAAQVAQGLTPRPERVYIATASGSSLAGLALGLSLAWPDPQERPTLLGVRVAPAKLINRKRVRRLYAQVSALLGVPPPPLSVELITTALGEGYARPTAEGESALRWAEAQGLTLEPTYTAKALGALLERERELKAPVLFWLT
jgi:D-cysteine desulfhydrase